MDSILGWNSLCLFLWLDGGKFSELIEPKQGADGSYPCITNFVIATMPNFLPQYILLSGCGVVPFLRFAIAIRMISSGLAYERAFGDVMPIQSSNIAMSLGLMPLWFCCGRRREGSWLSHFSCWWEPVAGIGRPPRGGWVMLPSS